MINVHDRIAGVGAEVADEDEALELRKETFEVDAVHITAAHSLSPEVGDVAAEDTVGLETAYLSGSVCQKPSFRKKSSNKLSCSSAVSTSTLGSNES